MKMVKTIEEYLDAQIAGKDIIVRLRTILLSTELKETLKWGLPTYQVDGKNVVGIGTFKSFTALWFFNGVFLTDNKGKLINAQEGKTKGLRQWRFESVNSLDDALIKEYVLEAIQNQKEGKVLKPEKKALVIPDELKEALAADSQLSESFDQLGLTSKR